MNEQARVCAGLPEMPLLNYLFGIEVQFRITL